MLFVEIICHALIYYYNDVFKGFYSHLGTSHVQGPLDTEMIFKKTYLCLT